MRWAIDAVELVVQDMLGAKLARTPAPMGGPTPGRRPRSPVTARTCATPDERSDVVCRPTAGRHAATSRRRVAATMPVVVDLRSVE